MKLFSIILFLSLSGCGTNFEQSVHVDPVLAPFVKQYSDLKLQHVGKPYTNRVSAIILDYKSPHLGYCTKSSYGRTITIIASYWNDLTTTDVNRLLLILHEMGHCDLNLEHSSQYGIMNSYLIGGSNYEVDPDHYLTQFFLHGI